MSNRRHFTKGKFRPRPRGKINPPSTNREYQNQNQLLETDVGITQFISKLEGFSGVIKARYSDFHVNEINLDGEVAKLTNLSVPAEFTKKEVGVGEPCVETPTPLIPQDKWDALKLILENPDQSVELDATNLQKDERGKIHEVVQEQFNNKIFANTSTKDEVKTMVFKRNIGGNQGGDCRFKWPRGLGEYVYFLVYKESLDTLDASLKIASCMRMSPSNLTYAGVKDKRAKTTQWFSMRKVHPHKLLQKTKPMKKVRLGNITFKDTPLKLGQLLGNKFRIALRNVVGDDDLIAQSLKSLQEKGFINYYGLQRFGNDKEVPTYSIGVQLLQGNWKEACEIILKPTESDNPGFEITKAKKVYEETKDAGKALAEFVGNKNSCIEYLLLAGLDKGHANDYVNALASIPRNTRLLYIHSFQSLVWNTVASKRIEKFGLEVVEGDLILLEEHNNSEVKDEDEVDKTSKPKVKVLSKDECANYTIYDIVLPLPGYDIIYPEHLKEFYKEYLEKYGLTLEMTKQKVQAYTLGGAYRKLLGQVKNLSHTIMHYNDPNYNLIRSDFEEMEGEKEPYDIVDGAYKALILEFSLTSSSYATMVLREILKTDTSSSSHAKLNNYHVPTTTEQKKVTKESEVSEDFNDITGLLSDKTKYEHFKNIVFNGEDESLKRKHEEEDNEGAKVAKTE